MDENGSKKSTPKDEWKPITRNRYQYDEVVSALQKEIRRGNEFNGLYWALELCESGFDLACWRRLIICAVEDVGLADEGAVVLVNNLYQMWLGLRKVEKGKARLPESNILALAILKLCRANKNRVADDLAYLMGCMRMGKDPQTGEYGKRRLRLEMQEWARDGHTEAGKQRLKEEYKEKWYEVFNKEFYEDSARENKPVEIEGKNWSKVLMEKVGCSYELYTTPISSEDDTLKEIEY